MKARFVMTATVAVAAMLACAVQRAEAIDLERLVMPGKVIRGHAKIENHCERCHEPFSRKSQSTLCLDCHEHTAADVQAGTGYHGRVGTAATIVCTNCHGEHEGREADIVHLDAETFDHSLTDFELAGAHRRVDCQACHRGREHYRDTPSRCVDCHAEVDPHQRALGEDCAKCHQAAAWAKVQFDHDRTSLPLKDAHTKVACDGCHASKQYAGTPATCAACHRLDDVHGGRHGTQCETCHTSVGWKRITFDHDQQTDFRLLGRHRDVACSGCHLGTLYQEKVPTDCYGCHRPDDAHKGSRGRKCQDCHDPRDWKRTDFDHDRDTTFPLRGAHAKVACEGCHRGNVKTDEPPRRCYGCHRADDPHRGEQGERCGQCHHEKRWDQDVFFDHDISRFPLIGLHRIVPCEECHATAAYADTPMECLACHQDDDHHDGRLGRDCAACHNPNGWARWIFDHDARTDFALDGAHAGLVCEACHTTPNVERATASAACFGCHEADDAHRGGFGRLCGACHTTEDFAHVRIER
jgi:hypothetical protein